MVNPALYFAQDVHKFVPAECCVAFVVQGSCNMGSGLYAMGSPSPQPSAGGAGGAGGARGEADGARARALGEQHRARLLQMQRSQQMLVSPEVTLPLHPHRLGIFYTLRTKYP